MTSPSLDVPSAAIPASWALAAGESRRLAASATVFAARTAGSRSVSSDFSSRATLSTERVFRTARAASSRSTGSGAERLSRPSAPRSTPRTGY